MTKSDDAQLALRIGICATCIHTRQVRHPRGGEDYWRCAKADDDPQYAKFPRMPVRECKGFERRPDG